MIINADHMSLYFIEDRETACNGLPDFPEQAPQHRIHASNGLASATLGYYHSPQEADHVLQQLLSALRSGKDTFYMPSTTGNP